MILFVASLGRSWSKEGRPAILIGDMDISTLMVNVQQVEEDKLRDKEEYQIKKMKTQYESGKKKGDLSRPHF